MRPLIDCPTCACLLDTRESACPFCGAVVRRTDGWSMLGLGFMIGLATAACGEKSGTSTNTDASTSDGSSGTDSASSTSTSTGETTIGDSAVPTTFGEVSAYAGPDTGDSFPDDTTSSTTSSDTGSETGTGTGTGTTAETGTTTDFPETSAYAGPDTTGG